MLDNEAMPKATAMSTQGTIVVKHWGKSMNLLSERRVATPNAKVGIPINSSSDN
jgi:hypothetical protein